MAASLFSKDTLVSLKNAFKTVAQYGGAAASTLSGDGPWMGFTAVGGAFDWAESKLTRQAPAAPAA